jgi:hypothetical protein
MATAGSGWNHLYPKSNGTDIVYSTLAAAGVGTPTACTNQFVTGLTLNADAAPTSTCTTATLASAQFANQGTTTTVLHGNGAGNPSFGSVVQGDVTNGYVDLSSVQTIAATGVKTFGGGTANSPVVPRQLAVLEGSTSSYATPGVTSYIPLVNFTEWYGSVQSQAGFAFPLARFDMITKGGQDTQSAVAVGISATCNGTNTVGTSIDNNINCAGLFISGAETSSGNLVSFDPIAVSTYATNGKPQTIQASQALVETARTPGWFGNPNHVYSNIQGNNIGPTDNNAVYQDVSIGTFNDTGVTGRGFLIGEGVFGAKQVGHLIGPAQGGTIVPDYGYNCAASTTACHYIGAENLYPINSAWLTNYSLSPAYGVIFGEKAANSGTSNVEAFDSTPAGTSCTLLASPNGASQSDYTATYTCNAVHGWLAGYIVHITGVTNTGYNIDCKILTVPTTSSFTCYNSNGYNVTNLGLTASGAGTATASPLQRWTFYNATDGTHHQSYASPPSGTGADVLTLSNLGTHIVAGSGASYQLNGATTSGRFATDGSGIFLASDTAAKSTVFYVNNGAGIFESNRIKNDGGFWFQEIAAPAGSATRDVCYGDSTAHALECSYNNFGFGVVPLLFNGQTFTGIAPASVSTTPGTAASSLLNFVGAAGGASTNASGTGGAGASATIAAGAGGAASGATASTGGVGGSVNFTAGAGGAGAGTGVNANGGSIVVTPGAAGTGGSGTAGKAGVLSVAGSTAGSVFYTQGSTNTVANTNIPANSIIEQAPAAVTAYTITKPAAAANGIRLNANASALVQESFSGDAAHALTQAAKTAAVTTFTLCAATAGTACGQVGQYRVSYNFWGSGTACSAVTAGSVGLNLTWTDENAVTHTTISVPMWDQKSAANGILFNFNTALGTEGASGSYVISTNGTIIQAATTYTACTTGTGTYNLRMTVEQLQ